jgi:hypothetical protein
VSAEPAAAQFEHLSHDAIGLALALYRLEHVVPFSNHDAYLEFLRAIGPGIAVPGQRFGVHKRAIDTGKQERHETVHREICRRHIR